MRLRKPTTSLSDCLFAIASKFLCLISFLVCIVPTDLSATHIVGGDVTYRFVSFNQDSTEVTYDITFNMYRDTESGGASFDDPVLVSFKNVKIIMRLVLILTLVVTGLFGQEVDSYTAKEI